MRDTLFFFYLASVSKSLLIVLGTLSLPAIVGREKYRNVGIPTHSRIGSDKPILHGLSVLLTALDSKINLPVVLTNLRPIAASAGRAGFACTSCYLAPATLTSRWCHPGYSGFLAPARQFYCSAVCPCQGSWIYTLA